ncbi:BamA/TamA family outer membrane protein [Dysgonomonas sp. ZJ279]|uniref:translocation and assembly module lipoprotein TamL n=1 Tax=Dysgonomonas sp. ZJ279 TaxID=2709796 RepID=UPI002104614A|nr:BamA/TamA family outer membrane protein [Dysgonomonas sp. ZJ279]
MPDGKYLLASAEVKSDTKSISAWELNTYIKQKPNFKTFEVFKLPLSIYNLSGHDSTKWVNKKLRHAGEPPVIYDSTQVDHTVVDLKRIMTNRGYLNAEVSPIITLRGKRARIIYDIKAGKPYKIDDYIIDVKETTINKELLPTFPSKSFKRNEFGSDTVVFSLDSILYRNSLVHRNSRFDLDMLDQERDRITSLFRRNGYYAFNKEYIGFVADTTLGNNKVELELSIYPFTQRAQNGQTTETPHRQYEVTGVDLYVDFNPIEIGDISSYEPTSIYEKDGYRILYGERGEYIKPYVILNNCFIRPGELYNENMTALTYSALSQLRILKNVNISYAEYWENDSTKLRCIITCIPDKKQGISTELEGTNSKGSFGVGAGIGYLHRNIFRGSEQFNVRLRGSYEAITPNFSSFKDNYFEIGGETSLTFPRFMFPLLDRDFRQRIHATTQLTGNYTYQRRPGFFSRTVLSSGVKYTWQDRRRSSIRHIIDLIDVSYIRVPESKLDTTFRNNLSEAAFRYSFTNQFIMSAGYTFSKTNANNTNKLMPSVYSLRASIESAGNVLALAAIIADTKKESGSRQIFGTNFAQYLKGTFDYSKTYTLDEKNSIAWHVGGGLAYPYGNFSQIPIEKRFFSGGANNVRGWAVRELGPGSFYAKDEKKDNFYYHSGEMRMDANIEYRSKLFWILELGAFIDAGNIWTVKGYEGQEQGQFQINTFYKEIAAAWGLGIRLNFDFVLIRLDAGWKAYDPSDNPNTRRWPISEPYKFKKNVAWHIAVGYPF